MSEGATNLPVKATMPEDMAGRRLDKALAELWPDYSRAQLKQWLGQGRLTVDAGSPAPKTPVRGGEIISLWPPELTDVNDVRPQSMPLQILHEDEAILVLNKPAGLVMHPGAGNPDGTLANGLLAYDPALADVTRQGIVHRLDKQTSGILVVARTQAAHDHLSAALAARQMTREYEAVSVGVMTAGNRIEAPVARHPTNRKKMAVSEEGKPAVTHYRVIRRYRAHTHIRCFLETGRTHQIRVHMAHVRYPLLGDPVYGRRSSLPRGASDALADTLRGCQRQALHASRLSLNHPTTGETMTWAAPRPADLEALLAALHKDDREHAHGAS